MNMFLFSFLELMAWLIEFLFGPNGRQIRREWWLKRKPG